MVWAGQRAWRSGAAKIFVWGGEGGGILNNYLLNNFVFFICIWIFPFTFSFTFGVKKNV